MGWVTDRCGSFSLSSHDYLVPYEDLQMNGSGSKESPEFIYSQIIGNSVIFNTEDDFILPFTATGSTNIEHIEYPCLDKITRAIYEAAATHNIIYVKDSIYNGFIITTEVGTFYHGLNNDGTSYILQFNYNGGSWKPFDFDDPPLVYYFLAGLNTAADSLWNKSTDPHFILGALGFVEVLGPIPDLLDGALYLLEGESKEALFSFGAAIPGVGIAVAATGKFILISLRTGKAIRSFGYITAAGEFVDKTVELTFYLNKFNIGKANDFIKSFRDPQFAGFSLNILKNPELIASWGIIYDVQKATGIKNWETHLPLLNKISDISNNPTLLVRLKGVNDIDGLDALQKLLKKNTNLPYAGCPSPPCNSPWLSNIEDVLQNLEDIDKLYPSDAFVNGIIGRLKGGGIPSRRGTIYEMQRILLRNNPNANLGAALKYGKKADYFDGTRYIEFKSSDNIVKKIDKSDSNSDYVQLKGYLATINSFDNYDLIFDKKLIAGKQGLDENDIINIANHAKSEMQKVFQENVDDIFDEIWGNSILQNNLFGDIDRATANLQFNMMVDNLDNKIFKSIKVE